MRERLPSQTAAFVAFARALADRGATTVRGFSDPYARTLLSPFWTRLLAFGERRMLEAGPVERLRSAQGVDPLVLRTKAIDRAIVAALSPSAGVSQGSLLHPRASGLPPLGPAASEGLLANSPAARQLVILGAGLDTRAHHMRELADVTVFEVDHPATQGWKVRRAAALPRLARELRYVTVDFEREGFGGPLAAAGHRADAPTVWLSEGVIMYLSDAALTGLLDGIVARSAPGSTALLHYHEPHVRIGLGTRVRDIAFRWVWGEPLIGLRREGVMAAAIARAGLVLEADTGGADWTRDFGATPPTKPDERVGHRLAIAHRA